MRTFVDSRREVKRSGTAWWQAFSEFSLLLILLLTQFSFVAVVLKYFNFYLILKGFISYLYTMNLSCSRDEI
jgi:hypothetical protein